MGVICGFVIGNRMVSPVRETRKCSPLFPCWRCQGRRMSLVVLPREEAFVEQVSRADVSHGVPHRLVDSRKPPVEGFQEVAEKLPVSLRIHLS